MICYFDSSALVKCYLAEDRSEEVKMMFNRANENVVSLIAYPEVFSAVYRRIREGHIPKSQELHFAKRFESDWKGFYKVNVSSDVIEISKALIRKHPLRAFDAIHIGSAIQASKKLKTDIVFLSFDEQQRRAAAKEKLTVID